jgi:hypothetical protein
MLAALADRSPDPPFWRADGLVRNTLRASIPAHCPQNHPFPRQIMFKTTLRDEREGMADLFCRKVGIR